MTTCNRCGKAVGTNDWDIHTCTPKPGLCDDCETVAYCLKHGCAPKHQALEQMAQNARLIAAAPDLLEALKEIAADYADRFDLDDPSTNPGIKSTIKQARAAIAKATGGAA